MTTFEIFVHLMTTLLPSVSVLAFLLLNRRQHIRAELEEIKHRHEHCQLLGEQKSQRLEAMSTAMKAFAPVLASAGQAWLEQLDARPASAADLLDHELLDELRRRTNEQNWNGPYCATGCSTIDDIFERAPEPGSPPAPGAVPPTKTRIN